jgi:hypothetical protein
MSVLDKLVAAAKNTSPVTGQDDVTAGLKAKKDNIDQYNKAVGGIDDPPRAVPPQTNPDKIHPKSKFGDRPGEKRGDVNTMSFKKGTTSVPKTGMAKVHKGEAVVPAEENPMNAAWAGAVKGEEKPKKEIHEVRTRKAKTGGYIHEHHHKHPEHHPMEEHTSASSRDMLAHMNDNMGQGGDLAAAAAPPDPSAGGAPDASVASPNQMA